MHVLATFTFAPAFLTRWSYKSLAPIYFTIALTTRRNASRSVCSYSLDLNLKPLTFLSPPCVWRTTHRPRSRLALLDPMPDSIRSSRGNRWLLTKCDLHTSVPRNTPVPRRHLSLCAVTALLNTLLWSSLICIAVAVYQIAFDSNDLSNTPSGVLTLTSVRSLSLSLGTTHVCRLF
jgi:hypothetical protein